MVFIEKKSHWVFWVFSSISAGLALLTKSPSIVVIPLVGLMLGVKYISRWKKQSQSGLWLGYIKWMLLFIGILCLVYVVLWPGMWVNPGKMLYEVFGNAISYAFQGSKLDVAKGLNPSRFSIDSSGIIPYFTSLFWRTTPITWLGVFFGCTGFFACIGKKADKTDPTFDPVIMRSYFYLGLLALIFVFIFGIAKGRNSPHYILMSFVSLEVIAGIGLVGTIRWIGARIKPANPGWVVILLATSLLGVHIASGISQFPYYYTYLNPLMRLLVKGNPDAGYGEGLEKAGEYLSNKPNGSTLTAISWFGYGPFSYFFSGQFIHMPPTDIIEPSLLEDIRQADYLVVYDIYQKRFYRPTLLMDSLNGISPEKKIKINNLDYVSIYKVSDLPESLFKSLNH